MRILNYNDKIQEGDLWMYLCSYELTSDAYQRLTDHYREAGVTVEDLRDASKFYGDYVREHSDRLYVRLH